MNMIRPKSYCLGSQKMAPPQLAESQLTESQLTESQLAEWLLDRIMKG